MVNLGKLDSNYCLNCGKHLALCFCPVPVEAGPSSPADSVQISEPTGEKYRRITAKFAELWTMKPNATFVELVEDVLGSCHVETCARLMEDIEFEKRLDLRLIEIGKEK